MQPLLTAEESHSADRFTIENHAIPELLLMEHAASAVKERLQFRYGRLFPQTSGLILAGTGNNGGDALALGRMLLLDGHKQIQLVQLGVNTPLGPSVTKQRAIIESLGFTIHSLLQEKFISDCDWIVDGLFGTGLSRPLDGFWAITVNSLNELGRHKWIVAIDIPSGLDSNTGQVLGPAIRASETVTLGFMKRGLVTGTAAEYVGKLTLATIQIPRKISAVKPKAFLLEVSDITLPPRKLSSHKGDYGHVYVWAGVEDKQGASILAGLGALKMGCGLVTLIADTEKAQLLRTRAMPELMVKRYSTEFFGGLKKGVCIMGPGMGIEDNHWTFLQSALNSSFPLVLDGDALTLISNHEKEATRILKMRNVPTIMTPHPKEASRLLGETIEHVQSNRYESCSQLANKYQSVSLLKGRGTIVAEPSGHCTVINVGNTVLSKGGSGDILSGIVGSLLAQRLPPVKAAMYGAYIHGRASELISQRMGEDYSSLASDLATMLPSVIKELHDV